MTIYTLYSNVAFNVKGRSGETGSMVFKASHSKTTEFHFDYDPALLSEEVAENLVKALRKSMK